MFNPAKAKRRRTKLPDFKCFAPLTEQDSVGKDELIRRLSKRVGDLEIQVSKLNTKVFGIFEVKK